ncbi:MAG: hypothetical protein PF503_13875, partial [Desulfobacula sp.]|nr:hypothetical protein [Desulfobacula sp.]
NDSEHKKLSNYIKRQKTVSWVMTYDNVIEIKKLYSVYNIYEFSLNYSLQEKRIDKEILIIPDNIFLPQSLKISGNNLQLSMVS